MTLEHSTIQPGFPDPVLDAQRTFRRVLEAMAQPGKIITLDDHSRVPPLCSASLAVALTLLDHETPLYLDSAARQPRVEQHLRFHCGCPLLDDPARAAFGILAESSSLLPLERYAWGSDESPEQSATLVVQVADLADHHGGLRLRGPGIEDQARLWIGGAPQGLATALAANHACFPRGVDLLFCAGQRLAALPRSTLVEA